MRVAAQAAVCSAFYPFRDSDRVEHPLPASIGKGERLIEVVDEGRPWNFFRAEPHDMRGRLLAVDELKLPLPKLLHEPDQCHF